MPSVTSGGERIEGSPITEYLYIVGDVAYRMFDCEPPPSVGESIEGASEEASEFFVRIHSQDQDAAINATYLDLIARSDAAIADLEFLDAMRFDFPEALSTRSDEGLRVQARFLCVELGEFGAQENWDAYHAPGSFSIDTDITDIALVGRSMFYWGGRAHCIEPHERIAWEDWVALELQFGNSEDNFNYMLYGLDNANEGNIGPEYEVGFAAAWSDDKWAEFIMGLIEGTLGSPGYGPDGLGQLHAFAAARVFAQQ